MRGQNRLHCVEVGPTVAVERLETGELNGRDGGLYLHRPHVESPMHKEEARVDILVCRFN